MAWNDPHTFFIVSAYGVSLLGLLGMVVYTVYHFIKIHKIECQD